VTFGLGTRLETQKELCNPSAVGAIGALSNTEETSPGSLARALLAAVEEGHATADLVRALALATLAAATPGTPGWLRAAALLESHPQRMRRAVLLAGEILALEEAQRDAGSE
jgi:hypothetical protein